jgi:ubiquinone biosynthesis protein
VLTLEHVYGMKIDDLAHLDAAGIDRPALARRATEIILKMVFEDGFFHADPHAGNFFIEADGKVGLIDFGMVGTVDEATQNQLLDVFLAVTSQNPDRMVDALLDLGVAGRRVDRNLLRRDLEHLLSRYYGLPLGEIKITPLLTEAVALIRRHALHLPPNLALLLKALMMAEALGTRLEPSFRLPTVIVPYAQRMMRRQYSPLLWAKRFGRSSLEAARLSAELPVHLRRLLGDLERGGLEIGMRPEGFEPLVRRFEHIANRIVLGIMAAAFTVGLAVLTAVYRPPLWEQWAGVVFSLGFAIASILGAYLAWTILRSGPG